MLPVHFAETQPGHFSQQRQWQEELLDEEVRLQVDKFRRQAETPARQLLDLQADLFVAAYLKHDSNGHAVLAFSAARGLPRLREHFQLLLLPTDLIRYRDWPAALTYQELIARSLDRTEVSCVWYGADRDAAGYLIAGFRGMSVEFSARLVKQCVLVLGPQLPPIEYLRNLIQVVRYARPATSVGQLLDLPQRAKPESGSWTPASVPETGAAEFLLAQGHLASERVLLVQGPPGTGKTYLLAEICDRLLKQNKSVLVTALTNRALLELAVKPQLASWREVGKVRKMSLSTDEQAEARGLLTATQLVGSPSTLLLATFHMTSCGAVPAGQLSPCFDELRFDYVLVDEASQALLPMLALARSLGQQHIWVGDTAQLPPIVQQSMERVKVPGTIRGLQTVSDHAAFPSFRLTHSFRLPARAAQFTGLFYNGCLSSIAPAELRLLPGNLSLLLTQVLHPDGGPVLLPLSLPAGQEAPVTLLHAVQQLISDLFQVDEPLSIAVLTHRRVTSRSLQRLLAGQEVPAGSQLIVDTVARVQGLTCDVCLFVIPAVGYAFSLQAAAFNVATSRARRHTIILAEAGLVSGGRAAGPVASFLRQLQVTRNLKA